MTAKLSEEDIDERVIAEAENDECWEDPVFVDRTPTLPPPDVITCDKDILSGVPVFRGTRVPVSSLLENLEAGVSLDEFLENFPTVKREQAIQILEYFKSSRDKFREIE